jgi:hypothetical protein
MIISNTIITTLSSSIILKGANIAYINQCIQFDRYKIVIEDAIKYYKYGNLYYIDISVCKQKKNLMNLLESLCSSVDYYSSNSKKQIILLHFDKLSYNNQQAVKNIIDNSFSSCIFIIHITNHNAIDANIKSRFIVFSLPRVEQVQTTTHIAYQKIITCLKKGPLSTTAIESIRELCYMYYMDHKDSIELQRLIVMNISSNLYLPNPIKHDVIKDITSANYLYQHSYRKPLFLEYIIISLFKHLQHYTYNLS